MTLRAVGNDDRMLLSNYFVVCKCPGGGTLLNSKCPAPGTDWASNAGVFPGRMLPDGIDSHITEEEVVIGGGGPF